jgi:hypothetical protein
VNFVEAYKCGKAGIEDLDEYVEARHVGSDDITLHEFLGMTRDEYFVCINDESALRNFLEAKAGECKLCGGSEVVDHYHSSDPSVIGMISLPCPDCCPPPAPVVSCGHCGQRIELGECNCKEGK